MIEVKNLTKDFNGFAAVDNISFNVEEGGIFGFIGPNGAGKTTTIRMLATILDPTSGTAVVGGNCIVNEPHEVRKVLGYMPDYYGVYDGITVREYLDFFCHIYGMNSKTRLKTINDVMELTDLGKLEDKLVSTLSKGMKQRLCLAKTLLHDPKVLILDEPAAGLDPRARIEMRYLMKELKDLGKTIFLSSHILTELEDICDSVGIIEKGRLIASGRISEIKAQLCGTVIYTIRVKEDSARAKGIIDAIQAVAGCELQEDDAGTVNVRMKDETCSINCVLKELMAADVNVIEVKQVQSNLEDIFMQITKGEVA